MQYNKVLNAIEGRTRIDRAEFAGLVPKRAVDHAVIATAAFLADDVDTANAHAAMALEKRPDLLVASFLTTRVFEKLPPDRLMCEGLHPWFGLQWMMQPTSRLPVEATERLGTHLLDTPIEDAACKARILEQVCEVRLRQSSLRSPETRDWLNDTLALYGSRAPGTSAFYQACLDHQAGSRQAAKAGFQRFLDAGLPVSHSARGASSYIVAPGPDPFEPRGFRLMAKADGAPIVFTADPVYFAEWSPLILTCLSRAPASVAVHFHIIGGADVVVPHVPPGLRSRVGLSVEADPDLGTPYYASARFVVAQHLLDVYAKPLIFSDIDAAFDPSVAQLIDALGDKPGAFLFKGVDNHYPWRSVTANLCYLTNDDRCRAALVLMARYLGTVFAGADGEQSLWWCDQNALAYALRASGLDRDAASFFKLRHELGGLPFRFAPNAKPKKAEFRRAEMERVT